MGDDSWIDDLNDNLTGSNKVEMDGWIGHMQDGYFIPDEPINPGKSSGDLRIDRANKIIQDIYDEAIYWHEKRISDGTDLRSGLRSLPYIPWDEKIDGVAAMMGGIGGLAESSYGRNGGTFQDSVSTVRCIDTTPLFGGALGCALLAVCGVVVVGLLLWMASYL